MRGPPNTKAAACWIAIAMIAGCQGALFPEEEQRSIFSRYNDLRGRESRPTTTDAYGREIPALRERLRPLEDTRP
jgi:hypothetical protein